MMLMMLPKGARIISIIGGSFVQSVFRYPPQPAKSGAGAQAHAHDADFGGS